MAVGVREFGVRNADDYWRLRGRESTTGERRLHRFLASLVGRLAEAGSHVLECGAGEGHVLRRCSRHYHVHAIELSSEAVAGYDFPTDSIHQVDLNEEVPDFDVLFQVIIASCLLHWLDRPDAFLEQLHGLLAPSGRLIVNIPNITHFDYRLRYLFGEFPAISLSHKNFQTPREFEEMARGCGYRVERRVSPRRAPHARLWPKLFSHDIVYVLASSPDGASRE